jgi:Golgi phosphoprotein 3 (GPP34)
MLRLTGRGRLADDLYLLAHHDVTGRPFLQPRALRLGLAGGLLAELLFDGAIWLRGGRVGPAAEVRSDDELLRRIVAVLLAERDLLPVTDWLAYLATGAAHEVTARLAATGYLAREQSWRPGRARWVPVDPDAAFAPLARVRCALDPARSSTVPDVVLTGLAVACGLGPRVLPFGPPGARRWLDEALGVLRPDLRELIAQLQLAVDSAVLAHRI